MELNETISHLLDEIQTSLKSGDPADRSSWSPNNGVLLTRDQAQVLYDEIRRDPWQHQMDDVHDWAEATFGVSDRITVRAKFSHLKKEVDELLEHYNKREYVKLGEMGKNILVRHEFADCIIILMHIAKVSGIQAKDLLEAISEKMAINKRRVWGKPDENGVIEHVKS